MSEGEIVLQSICAGTLSLDHTRIGFFETLTNLYDLEQYFHRKIRLSICLMNSFRPLQPFISLFTPNAIFKMCFKMFQVCIIIHVTMFQIPFLILLKSHVIKYIKQTDFIT